jgi:hypothetical protein
MNTRRRTTSAARPKGETASDSQTQQTEARIRIKEGTSKALLGTVVERDGVQDPRERGQ